MKHNIQITIILLVMFIVTQLIGLAVINAYSPRQEIIFNQTTGQYENVTITPQLPYGMQPPEISPTASLASIVIAMVIAIALIFLLTRIKAALFLRLWFFFVVIIALGITMNAVLFNFTAYSPYIALIIALPLAFFKIFKRSLLVHNITELMIYPGIATVFVPILNIWVIVVLLLLISVYDIYAVWHSKIMEKMAKFQINKLKIFTGFFVPYIDKKTRLALKQAKGKKGKGKKVKVNLAILGGGDVVFPLITAGVVLVSLGLIPALFISVFSTIALLLLFVYARKGKFYPAMPFLTAGCLLGLLLAYLYTFLI